MTLVSCTRPITASKSSENDSRVQRVSDVPAAASRYKVYFMNEQEGWLASGKKLWRTTDGGRNWRLAYGGELSWDIAGFISNIQFISSQIGWIVVSPEGLYKTEDGGSTWKWQGDPFDGAIHSVKFFNDGKRWWAAGVVLHPPPRKYADKVPREDSYAVIAHTDDGGMTWNQQIMPYTRAISDFYFIDEEHGWALGSPGLFYLENKTNRWREVDFYRDGCANQMLLKTLNPENVVYEPLAIYFLDANSGWLSFKNGYMAKTTDGGRTWCDLLNPRDVWPDPIGLTFFWKLHFIDSMRGWGVGYSSLYETKDGGISWNRIDVDAIFEDMFFLDTRRGWAVAKEGLFRIIP